MLLVDSLGPEDRGEIDFILSSPDFSDAEKNIIISDIVNSIIPEPVETPHE